MLCPNLKNVCKKLNYVCVTHAKFNNYKLPDINSNIKTNKHAIIEIDKMINYLKHPFYSHLYKK